MKNADAEHNITQLTRSEIIELFGTGQWGRDPWYGELDEVQFLSRLYNLQDMPSTDSRYDNAAEDIHVHCIANYDYEHDFIFEDPRFDLKNATDETFVRFLSETLHPELRRNPHYRDALLASYNELLEPDGWVIAKSDEMSGRPIFSGKRIASLTKLPQLETPAPQLEPKTPEAQLGPKTKSSSDILEKPWISGPRELLEHGIGHLDRKSAFDCRIAFISIDNAVELMIKSHLGLPKRISGIQGLTRSKYSEMSSSFPKLIDGLEEYCKDKLNGIELGDIEWFHRLRNQLYHDGNGVTVEWAKAEAYAGIAKVLFSNLFGVSFEVSGSSEHQHSTLVGDFIQQWAVLERELFTQEGRPVPPSRAMQQLLDTNQLTQKQAVQLNNIRKLRNELVHGADVPKKSQLKTAIQIMTKVIGSIHDWV